MRRLALLSILAVAAPGCGSSDSAATPGASPGSSATPPVTAPPDATPAPDAAALVVGADGPARGPLPAHVDPRVDAILTETVPDDVVLVYASIGRRSPVLNYRWNLDRAGHIFFVRRGDSADDAIAFDQPLPDKPSEKLDSWHLKEVLATLVLHHVYDHPGYERGPGSGGGDFVIVRARQPDTGVLHTLVFDNSRPELLDFLEAVTVAL